MTLQMHTLSVTAALLVLVSPVHARDSVTLSDGQMDRVTAGVVIVGPFTFNLPPVCKVPVPPPPISVTVPPAPLPPLIGPLPPVN
jgi:hypothetical protein